MVRVSLVSVLLLAGCGAASDYVWTRGGCQMRDGSNCERIQDDYPDTPISGPEGPQGEAGPAGEAGAPGADGQDGMDGVDGADGAPGVDGQDGVDGVDGQDGQDGVDGTSGADGADGASCTIQLRDPVVKPCGTEYKEWLVCPDNTEAEIGKRCV